MQEEVPSERIIYGARVGNNNVITIKEYLDTAKINNNREDKFIMSISYLSGAKRGTVFFLTETGYIVGKYYEYSVRKRKYRLLYQTGLIDSVEVLFDQFEKDYKISPHLQAVDFDVYSCGAWISKRFRGIHPIRTHSSIVQEFINNRDSLNYVGKLKQQLGRRDDPIERVISIFHEWQKFVDMCVEIRSKQFLEQLDAKKARKKNKRFSLIEDNKTDEDEYYSAVDEVMKIKEELSSNDCSDYRIIEIKRKLPYLQEIISNKHIVDQEIDDNITLLNMQLEDTEIDEI